MVDSKSHKLDPGFVGGRSLAKRAGGWGELLGAWLGTVQNWGPGLYFHYISIYM